MAFAMWMSCTLGSTRGWVCLWPAAAQPCVLEEERGRQDEAVPFMCLSAAMPEAFPQRTFMGASP